MNKRGLGLLAAVSVVVAARLGWQHRRGRLTVTLYSEPRYRGIRQSFTASQRIHALDARLPRIGSVRVAHLECTFRRSAVFWSLLRSAITDPGNRSEAVGWLGLAALRALDPASWRRERDPAGDIQSWARLWAERPDGEGGCHGKNPAGRWHDVVEDTPDLAGWGTRARFIQVGVCGRHRRRS
jgi:hypothetical protein